MQQFQDDIMRAKQMATDFYEKLTARIDELEKRIKLLESKSEN